MARSRVYCSVHGCLNSKLLKPTLSFFKLPAEAKRAAMGLRWLKVLAVLCVYIAAGHAAAVPTQDTLVVSRSDDVTTETATAAVESNSTEEPVPPIKLTEMTVDSEVSLRYAHTAVVAKVRNPAKRAQEANFRVLLPETAFISGFVMTLGGKSYKAYVKEKEEAKQIYDQAVSQGLGAAHVAAKARDSNQFVVSVNVEPSSSAVFNLTYEELLIRRNGVYNHAINLHPGALVPKLSVTVHIKEAEKITDLRVPEIRTGNEIDATKDDNQNAKAVISRGHDDREATITFTPDLEDQKKLMQIYSEKSKESTRNTHRWYDSQDEEATTKTEGVLGQFVVQYDVDRKKEGEILVNDGYFVHFFAPTSLPPLNKYVVFVLDTSGSMMDRKIVQLREAMQAILSDLNPGDFFSIVEFASSVTVHDLKEADQEPPKRQYYYSDFDKKPTLVAPSLATPQNIEKAKVIISRLDAAGGTNIANALDVAVNLIHKRSEWGKNKETNVTAEGTTTEETTTEITEPALNDIERMKTLEPIIIFLTDGDPTVGDTNPTTIINRLTEKNYGEEKASIFSLAFGEDADRKFLRKLSLRNDGFMRHIYEAADAALQLHDFYKQVSSPLLADVKFTYPENQVKSDSLTKHKFRTFYAGSEVVVAGQIADSVTELTPRVDAFCGVDDGFGKKRYEKLPKAPVPVNKQEYLPLERLWSYLTIKQLLDEKDATEDNSSDDKKEDSPAKKALALALKYEFVTPLTSLVVVKPNATNAVDAESVDKPNSQPVFGLSQVGPPGGGFAASPGFAYASLGGPLGAAGIPGPAPASIGSFYASEALSIDDLILPELEESEDYNSFDNQGSPPQAFYTMKNSVMLSNRFSSGNPWGTMTMTGNKIAIDSFDRADISQEDSLQTSVIVPSTTAQPKPNLNPAQEYNLQDFSWVQPLINSADDLLKFDINGTSVDLKLTKNSDVPKKSEGDSACDLTVSGGTGVCVYLTRCASAKTITVDLYKNTYCSVNEGYAGVCCSPADVDINKKDSN